MQALPNQSNPNFPWTSMAYSRQGIKRDKYDDVTFTEGIWSKIEKTNQEASLGWLKSIQRG